MRFATGTQREMQEGQERQRGNGKDEQERTSDPGGDRNRRPERIRDLTWALLLGGLFAASPHSGAARLIPSLVLGAIVGATVFFGRRFLRPRYPGFFREAPPLASFRSIPARVWLLLFTSIVVFLPALSWLVSDYTFSIWRNGHGLFLPVIIFFLARRNLRDDPESGEESSAWGIPLALAGAVLAALDAGMQTGIIGTLGIVLFLPGLSLLLLGARRTRRIAFPLALAVFFLPLPAQQPDPLWLPSATSFLMEQYLRVLELPVVRDQTYFVLPIGTFGVSANCSGLSFVYGAFLAFLVLSATLVESWPRRIFMLLSIWPITVFINSIRGAIMLALCHRYGMGIAEHPIHGLLGIAVYGAVIGSLFAFVDWRRILREAS
jgi:exosortase